MNTLCNRCNNSRRGDCSSRLAAERPFVVLSHTPSVLKLLPSMVVFGKNVHAVGVTIVTIVEAMSHLLGRERGQMAHGPSELWPTHRLARFPVKSYPSQLVLCQLVPKSSRIQYKLVPKSSRTHSISYPSQLVPNTISYPKHNQRRQNPSVRDLLSPTMKKRLDPRQCHSANVIGVSKSIDENIVVDTVELGGAQV